MTDEMLCEYWAQRLDGVTAIVSSGCRENSLSRLATKLHKYMAQTIRKFRRSQFGSDSKCKGKPNPLEVCCHSSNYGRDFASIFLNRLRRILCKPIIVAMKIHETTTKTRMRTNPTKRLFIVVAKKKLISQSFGSFFTANPKWAANEYR